jgi:hypothetical protein
MMKEFLPTKQHAWGFLGLCSAFGALEQAASALPGVGIVTSSDALPPREAAYHGGGIHMFLGGQARATCSSHGGFTSSVQAPSRSGSTVVADYSATFVGELTLDPPLAPRRTVYPIRERAHMVERIRLAEVRGDTRVFETEMVTLDIRGGGLPAGVMFRVSPSARSAGRATVTALPRGRYQIDGFFDIRLEISLDGGRTWHQAQEGVRMALGPRS